MESSASELSGDHAQIVPEKCNTIFPTMYRSSRRTPSFSSSSPSSCSSSFLSSSSCDPDLHSSPSTPATPLRFSGVPFSWERLPGIPKKPSSSKSKKELFSSLKSLPLPPPTVFSTPKTSKKFMSDDIGVNVGRQKISSKGRTSNFPKDPFFAALVECSKDDHDGGEEEGESNARFSSGAKVVSRCSSDRFGFVNLYTSCKRTCAVSESIIHLPRPSRTSYDLINHRYR